MHDLEGLQGGAKRVKGETHAHVGGRVEFAGVSLLLVRHGFRGRAAHRERRETDETRSSSGVATISELGPYLGNRDGDSGVSDATVQPSQRPSMAEVVGDPFFTGANGGGGDGGGESNKKQHLCVLTHILCVIQR